MILRCKNGFTLLEVMITVSILAVLATVSFGYYRNYARQIELRLVAQTLISDLRSARAKALSGIDGVHWGVHFVNGATQYYEVYSTPTDYSDAAKVVNTTVFLQSSVIFTDPSTGSADDVLFTRATGATTPNTVTIISEGSPIVVTVTADGTVY